MLRTFNEIRDYQHAIARQRDGMIKKNLRREDKDNRKHSFLYGYKQSKDFCANRRLVGKKGDNV